MHLTNNSLNRANEKVHQVESTAAKSIDLSSISGTHTVEGEPTLTNCPQDTNLRAVQGANGAALRLRQEAFEGREHTQCK